jgi:hypothetical protein
MDDRVTSWDCRWFSERESASLQSIDPPIPVGALLLSVVGEEASGAAVVSHREPAVSDRPEAIGTGSYSSYSLLSFASSTASSRSISAILGAGAPAAIDHMAAQSSRSIDS